MHSYLDSSSTIKSCIGLWLLVLFRDLIFCWAYCFWTCYYKSLQLKELEGKDGVHVWLISQLKLLICLFFPPFFGLWYIWCSGKKKGGEVAGRVEKGTEVGDCHRLIARNWCGREWMSLLERNSREPGAGERSWRIFWTKSRKRSSVLKAEDLSCIFPIVLCFWHFFSYFHF